MDHSRSYIDEKLFLLFNGNHNPFLDHTMLLASNLFLCIPILFLAAVLANKYFKKQDSSHPLINSVLLIGALLIGFFVCLGVLPQFFSPAFQMERPCLNPNISAWVRLVGEDCNSVNGFFAIRPCIMFCITSFLLFTIKNNFPGFKIMLVIWSLVVSYSRVYLGAHYPLNVLIADCIGFALGYLLSRLYFYLKDNILVI